MSAQVLCLWDLARTYRILEQTDDAAAFHPVAPAGALVLASTAAGAEMLQSYLLDKPF